MALFEACCKEKIQQFEDAGSDEEDIWDEKDVTFAPEAQRRPRYCNQWNITFEMLFIMLLPFFFFFFILHILLPTQELGKYRQ